MPLQSVAGTCKSLFNRLQQEYSGIIGMSLSVLKDQSPNGHKLQITEALE